MQGQKAAKRFCVCCSRKPFLLLSLSPPLLSLFLLLVVTPRHHLLLLLLLARQRRVRALGAAAAARRRSRGAAGGGRGGGARQRQGAVGAVPQMEREGIEDEGEVELGAKREKRQWRGPSAEARGEKRRTLGCVNSGPVSPHEKRRTLCPIHSRTPLSLSLLASSSAGQVPLSSLPSACDVRDCHRDMAS